MPRIQGLAETGVLTGNQLVKNAPGEVHSLTIAWVGATAGNIIAYLFDATSDTANPGDHEVVIVAGAADGTFAKEWPQGKRFDTGIYYKEGSAVNVYAEMTFK